MSKAGWRIKYATVCCLCCCGGLPILAIVKALLNLPFVVAILVGGNVLLTLGYLPVNIWRASRTILQTPYWGPKIKAMCLILLPAAALVPIPGALISSVLYAVVVPFGISSVSTFMDEEVFEDEIFCEQPIRDALEKLQLCHDFWSEGFDSFLTKLREPANPGEITPRTISFSFLLLVLLQTTSTTIAFLAFNVLTVALKAPFIFVGGYINTFLRLPDIIDGCCTGNVIELFFSIVVLPIAVLAYIACWPLVVVVVSALAVTVNPLALALECAVSSYRYNSVASGFARMMFLMQQIDAFGNSFLLENVFCCCATDNEAGAEDGGMSCLGKWDPKDYANKKRSKRVAGGGDDGHGGRDASTTDGGDDGHGSSGASKHASPTASIDATPPHLISNPVRIDVELGVLQARTGASRNGVRSDEVAPSTGIQPAAELDPSKIGASKDVISDEVARPAGGQSPETREMEPEATAYSAELETLMHVAKGAGTIAWDLGRAGLSWVARARGHTAAPAPPEGHESGAGH
jgi:hypothetical protein